MINELINVLTEAVPRILIKKLLSIVFTKKTWKPDNIVKYHYIIAICPSTIQC